MYNKKHLYNGTDLMGKSPSPNGTHKMDERNGKISFLNFPTIFICAVLNNTLHHVDQVYLFGVDKTKLYIYFPFLKLKLEYP